MPREGKLVGRSEDADARVASAFRRQDEGGFGEVHLASEALHLLGGEGARVGEDRELVALERRIREYVGDGVAERRQGGHAASLDASVDVRTGQRGAPDPAAGAGDRKSVV